MKFHITTLMLAMLVSFPSLAHGVHDSGAIKPQKGGVLKSLESVHLELVQMGQEIRIYVYNTETPPKAEKVSQFPVSAKVVLPRKKGTQDLVLKANGDHWTTSYDAKGIHRFDFVLTIEQNGHKDKVVFTVEPKK
ncbi:MAG: hypothetical protein KDD61_06400 [Bdellovibrionales bacterium]|nr:hypothetical protein [Bdellovibrionales bacterium]